MRLPSGLIRHAGDPVRMAPEGEFLLPRDGIPHFHRLVRPSSRETMRLPSGLNAALWTPSIWPLKESFSCPVSASHTLPSCRCSLDDAFAVGTERHTGDQTRVALEGEFLPPVSASHTFTVLSKLPLRRCVCRRD